MSKFLCLQAENFRNFALTFNELKPGDQKSKFLGYKQKVSFTNLKFQNSAFSSLNIVFTKLDLKLKAFIIKSYSFTLVITGKLMLKTFDNISGLKAK